MLHPEPIKGNIQTATNQINKRKKRKPSDGFDESPNHNLYIDLNLINV